MLAAVVTSSVPDNDAGTVETVRKMQELVRSRIAHPTIRMAAVAIDRETWARSVTATALAIRSFVARRVRFTRDPDGKELLQDPVFMLEEVARHAVASGDCDDIAMLVAALALSVGIEALFVVVAFPPTHRFTHTWAELWTGRGWIECDTSRLFQSFGRLPVSRHFTHRV